MAQEITVYTGLKVLKANLKLDIISSSSKFDLTGTHKYSNVQDVGTTYEAVALGADLGTAGWAFFKNLDATNFLELGVEVAAAFYPFCKLKAGETALFPIGGTLFSKANTATCKLQVEIVER